MTHSSSATRTTGTLRALLLTVAVGLSGTGRPVRAQQALTLSPAERSEVVGYSLSIDKARRFAAVGAELSKRLATDSAFRAASAGATGADLSAQAALLEGVPQAAAALRASGFTAHEYAVGSRAFRDALIMAGLQARGRAIGPEMQALFPASAAQVAFVTTHQAELDVIAPEHRARAGRP